MIPFIRSFIRRLLSDNISFLAGGVAFYGMLALFPAMASLVSLFGLVASPSAVGEQLTAMQALFPPEAFKIIQDQMATLLEQPDVTLSFTFVIGLLLTIYSSTKGTKAILAAVNEVFQVRESRSWLYQQILSFSLTFGGLLLMMLAVFIVIAIPLLLRLLPVDIFENLGIRIEAVRWIILSGSIFCGLFLLFAYGPNRPFNRQCARAIFWGSFIAATLWIASAVGGSILLQIFPKVNAAYGSLSAIIALMTWLYVSAYIVLIGGAITATAEELGCNKNQESCNYKNPGLKPG